MLLLGILVSPQAAAQILLEEDQYLASDRPEVWVMGYLHGATQFYALNPQASAKQGFDLAVEMAHIPHLSPDQQRVGLNGIKLEDLNKTPLFGRIRLGMPLPADLRLELAWTPPLKLNGAKADEHFAIALQGALWTNAHWRTLARAYFLSGSVSGDITCPSEVATFAPGSAENPFGCHQASQDRFHARSSGVELVAAYTATPAWSPYVSVSHAWHRYRTQVDALVYQVHDRTRLHGKTHGWSLAGGIGYRLNPRWQAVAELRWTPLDVQRPPATTASSDDALNLRLLLRRSWP